MKANQLDSIAIKYCVEDILDSLTPGSALYNVICRLEMAPDYIPETTKEYLLKSKLNCLYQYVCNQISFDEFTRLAKLEQEKRKLEAEEHRKTQTKQNQINAEKKRKQQKIRKLLNKFDLDPSDVNPRDKKKLIDIVGKLDRGARINQNELAWLIASGRDYYLGYYTRRIRNKYHKIEAELLLNKYQKSKNLWDIINSSSHFRKCNCSKKASSILANINISKFKKKK